jgi:nitroimidazol reductase NimA-like FMN-containing flavoprotein (pyridoxamine 5'-phosphate oxidase superfamily)
MNGCSERYDQSGLEILAEAECRRLLESVQVGRLVFTSAALPAVRLVNFVVDADTIVFATADGDRRRAAERGDVVAFEVDDIDLDRQLGWTVTAVGHLSVVDADELEELQQALPLRPWPPDLNRHLIRLGIESLDGRRLVAWAQRQHEDPRQEELR